MDLVMVAAIATFISFMFGVYLTIARNVIIRGNQSTARALEQTRQIRAFENDVRDFAQNEFGISILAAQGAIYNTGVIGIVQVFNIMWVFYTMLYGDSYILNTIAAFANALMVPVWRKTQNDKTVVAMHEAAALVLLSAAITYQELEKEIDENPELHTDGSPNQHGDG